MDQAWRLGTGLWQPGPDRVPWTAVTPMPAWLGRAMTWAVPAGWLGFAGIALVGHLRPWVWLTTLLINVICLPAGGYPGLALALAGWHLATFDPRWLPVGSVNEPERLFYDGNCGLCHRWVRFVLAEDRVGVFILSPLQSQTFEQVVPAEQRAQLPDSIVIQRLDGRLLVRSAAVLHILDQLGGVWRIASWFGRVLPRPVADGGYRLVASVRNRLFKRPSEVCPLMPPDLRQRFEM